MRPPRARLRILALLAVLAALALLMGCERDYGPSLIQVDALAPRQVELGDRLEVSGVGFPQGHEARLTFRGVLHRPGEDPVTGASIDVEGEVAAPDRIEVPVTAAVLALFCRGGALAVHTTFEGALDVVFAASSPGAPPVAGTLLQTTLDLMPPSPSRAIALDDAQEASRLLAAVGLHAGTPQPGGGLVIASVDAQSPAARAGLLPDDLVVAASGVRTQTLADLAPPPSATAVTLAVRRGAGAREELHQLAVPAGAAAAPRRFAVPAILVAAVALLILLRHLPRGATIPWLRARAADRGPTSETEDVPVSLWAAGSVLVFLLGWLAPRADVSLVLLVSWMALACTSLLASRSLGAGAVRALHTVVRSLLPAIACFAVVTTLGSLRADEITAVQGGWPWGFGLFRGPAHPLLGVAALLPFCVRTRDGAAASSHLARAEALARLLGCALFAILFLGGARVPGLASGQARPWALVGAGILLLKTWAALGLLTRLRRAIPELTSRAFTVWLLKWAAPAALAASLVAWVWEARVADHGLRAATSFATLALVAALLLALVPGRPAKRPALDAFL